MTRLLAALGRYRPRHMRKAIAAAAAAGVVPAAAALQDLDLTRDEAGLIIGTALVAFVGVFVAPANAPVTMPAPLQLRAARHRQEP